MIAHEQSHRQHQQYSQDEADPTPRVLTQGLLEVRRLSVPREAPEVDGGEDDSVDESEEGKDEEGHEGGVVSAADAGVEVGAVVV